MRRPWYGAEISPRVSTLSFFRSSPPCGDISKVCARHTRFNHLYRRQRNGGWCDEGGLFEGRCWASRGGSNYFLTFSLIRRTPWRKPRGEMLEERRSALSPPGMERKNKKKKRKREKRRMSRQARSILPTMLLLWRCCIALFLDYDGTGGRVAYAPLFVLTHHYFSYPSHSSPI